VVSPSKTHLKSTSYSR